MFKLPPPPRFALLPPPIFPPDVFDSKIPLQLTCSLIRQQHQQKYQINLQLIFISCMIFCGTTVFFTLLFMWIQSCSTRQKPAKNNFQPKLVPTDSKNISIYNNCSYETIPYDTYLESINTTGTTLSINSNQMIYNHCHSISPSLSHSYYETIPY